MPAVTPVYRVIDLLFEFRRVFLFIVLLPLSGIGPLGGIWFEPGVSTVDAIVPLFYTCIGLMGVQSGFGISICFFCD